MFLPITLIFILGGRYHKPASTPAHLRLCKDCESVEDELHFVCVCPKYDSLQEHIVSIVCNDNPNFVFLSVNDTFLYNASSRLGLDKLC